MSVTTGTFPGVRVVDMPDLGAITDDSSMVGEHAGSGRFSAPALKTYVAALPLTGGTLDGPGNLTVHGNLTVGTMSANVDYGSAAPFLLRAVATMSGVPPTGGLYGQVAITIPSDTANAAGNHQGLSALPIQYNFGGVGFSAGRTGINVAMNQTGDITDPFAHFLVGGNFGLFSNHANPPLSAGLIGVSPIATLGASATGFAFVESIEGGAGMDCDGVPGRWGVTMFPLGSKQGTVGNDYAYSVGGAGNTTARWRVGYGFGRTKSPWGMDPAGSLFGTNTMTTGHDGPISWLNQTAGYGFNFAQVNFATAAIWTSGNKVLPDGTHQIGTGAIAPTSTGLSVDVVGYVGSAPTISAQGSGYAAFDQVYDGYGGIYVISSVGGAGNITAITLSGGRPPYSYGGAGPATLPLIGGQSDNQDGVIGVTWTQQRALRIQPTAGGTLGFYGAAPVAKQTGVAVDIAAVHAALTSLGLIAP